MPERPTHAEFDIGDRVEDALRVKSSQRPSDASVVAMAVAEYRKGLLENAARTEKVLCDRIAELEFKSAADRQLLNQWEVERLQLKKQVAELETTLNTPHTAEFLEAVRVEAAHQRERWPSAHDAGKTDADWFWLFGYLAGKAIRPDTPPEKKLHHIVTTAAACLNWHAHATGADTRMRPGIEPPATGGAHG